VRTLFVTGTDTGVGKTVVTTLLLRHLRQSGVKALAMKPFATGARADARRLNAPQRPEALALDEVNPFFFRLPVAPVVAARREGRRVTLVQARAALVAMGARCDVLLVEGCGGLLTPLGESFTLLDLMPSRHARVIVVAPNRLGVLNHARLTVERLTGRCGARLQLALVDTAPARHRDASRSSNLDLLRELLAPVPVRAIPHLGVLPTQLCSRSRPGDPLSTAVRELADLGLQGGFRFGSRSGGR